MTTTVNNNTGLIIGAAVAVLVSVLATLYFTGTIGGKDKAPTVEVHVEKAAAAPAEKSQGFTFKYEDGDGKKTELKTP